ncbi:MAG: DUF1273 family protein [Clostridia bacterium]|nr:DUF1273 family protein [Clostridia bacterium]
MQQLEIFTTELPPPKSCAFTGHRVLTDGFSPRKLKKEIKKLILQGVDTFYNGMAMGFDLLAAEKTLELKKKYPNIRLILCIPCYEQEKNFCQKDKDRYAAIYKKADERVYVADAYYRGCMQARNRYMADRADVLIAYCEKSEGGAAYTVNYFKKTKPQREIIFV